jgi:hypothetical protein
MNMSKDFEEFSRDYKWFETSPYQYIVSFLNVCILKEDEEALCNHTKFNKAYELYRILQIYWKNQYNRDSDEINFVEDFLEWCRNLTISECKSIIALYSLAA